jgi:hypothetical protein
MPALGRVRVMKLLRGEVIGPSPVIVAGRTDTPVDPNVCSYTSGMSADPAGLSLGRRFATHGCQTGRDRGGGDRPGCPSERTLMPMSG